MSAHRLIVCLLFGALTLLDVGCIVLVLAAPDERPLESLQVAALTEMMEAVNAADAKGYARLYSPDAVIRIRGTGELKGRPAIEQHEAELLRAFPGTRLAFYHIWLKGPLAVVHYGVNGRSAKGEPMGHEGLLFYRFHPSGLIEEERRYQDSLTPMAQMGLLGARPARPLPRLPSEPTVHVADGSPDESRNLELVMATLAFLNSRNEPAFLSNLAEEAVLDELMDPQPLVGKEKVKGWFARWTGSIPDASSELTSVTGIGEFVLVETLVRGRLQGPFGPVQATGREFVVHRAAVVQVKDGKLAHISYFMNGKELAEGTGQWPLRSGSVESIVSEIRRADYEGDRAALRELHEDLGPFLRNEGISSRVLYWRGFALWRRAFNGFNDGADAKELEDDLQLAAAEFKEALAQDPAFVDAKIAMASCLMTLTFLHQKQGDAAGVKVLVSQFVPLLREAANSAPDNPRVLWVLAMSQFNNPPERGGGQEKGIETNLRGLEAARAQRNHPTGPLDPSWGEPELLMSLAWSNLNRETPDLEAAERYAGGALNLVPYWHYVRDILLPQIQAAKAKREQSVVIQQNAEHPRLYRVILPVADIERSAKYYTELLGVEGVRVSPGRHYFDCGGVILALYDPKADGDDQEPRANLEHVYFAVSDLEAAYKRAEAVGGLSKEVGDGDLPMGKIAVRPWGERSFYLRDPTGNPLCFVDENTVFTGR